MTLAKETNDPRSVQFPEYVYTGLSGNKYCPQFHRGVWYLVNQSSLAEIALLCDIPLDEVNFLLLTYGP